MGKKVDKCLKKYGSPLYGVGWLDDDIAVVCGGGGKKGSGIPNRLVCARFDGKELSEELCEHVTGDDCPLKLAVHPDKKTVVVALDNGGLKQVKAAVTYKPAGGNKTESSVNLEAGRAFPTDVMQIGEQKSVAFNSDGTILACGGDDGNLHLFKWPSMAYMPVIPRPREGQDPGTAHKDAVSSIDFSHDSKLVVTTGGDGTCIVWDVMRGSRKAVLSVPGGGRGSFRGACFARDGTYGIYTCLIVKGEGHVVKWAWSGDTYSVGKRAKVSKEPLISLAISPCGEFLGTGNSEGEVKVLYATSLASHRRVQAHMIFTTGCAFSPDSKALASVSADAGLRCTACGGKPGGTHSFYLLLLVILLWAMLYYSPLASTWGPGSNGEGGGGGAGDAGGVNSKTEL